MKGIWNNVKSVSRIPITWIRIHNSCSADASQNIPCQTLTFIQRHVLLKPRRDPHVYDLTSQGHWTLLTPQTSQLFQPGIHSDSRLRLLQALSYEWQRFGWLARGFENTRCAATPSRVADPLPRQTDSARSRLRDFLTHLLTFNYRTRFARPTDPLHSRSVART